MSEEKMKRRGWVKNAAIIFLAVMLIFTLYSNTIMNRLLPEVSAQQTQSTNIITRVRGQGTVSANESYEVTIKETREIRSVPIRIGQSVEIGDVIILLADRDSEEIQTAEKELADLRTAHEEALISASGINYEKENLDIARAREDLEKLKAEKNKGAVSDEEMQAAKDKVKEIQAKVDDYAEQVAYYEYMYAQNPSSFGYATLRDAAKVKLTSAEKDLLAAEKELEELEGTHDGAGTLDEQILTAERAIEDMVISLNEKKIADGKQQALTNIKLREMQKDIDEKVKEIEKLRDNTTGNAVESPVRGTVKQINVSAGNTATAETPLMLIDVIDRGYTVSFAVTNEQAAKVKVGDLGEVMYYYGEKLTAILDSIKNDPQRPGQGKLLTFVIQGEAVSGEQLTITVGQRSLSYDVVVPNSAIREDSNGKFVYQLATKSSPLGNRFMAMRVPVTILAQDDMNAAIESALSSGWQGDFVITTSSSPLTHGMYVRQADNT